MEPTQQIRRFVRRWTDRLILERKRITVMDQLANENKLKEEILALREQVASLEKQLRISQGRKEGWNSTDECIDALVHELETAHNILGSVIDALPTSCDPNIGWADLGGRVAKLAADLLVECQNSQELETEVKALTEALAEERNSKPAIPETSSKPSEQNQ